MDDLLADDIKQGGDNVMSEAEVVRQRSNQFSDRGSTNKTKKQQLSELGGDNNNCGRVSIQLTHFGEGLAPNDAQPTQG